MEILTVELLVGMMVWGMWEGGREGVIVRKLVLKSLANWQKFPTTSMLKVIGTQIAIPQDLLPRSTFTLLKPSSSKSVRIASQHWMRVGINAIFY